MVTLTGAGGVGKTQTALHAALAESDRAGSAVCFIELASIATNSLVVAAISSKVGVQEVPNSPLLDTLLAYLKNKALLLVLDNCEHVVAEAASVASALLAECPRLRILATSREPLRAAGERSYRLPSLNTPSQESSHQLGTADAAAYGAMTLFADRARAVDHRFTLTDENAPIIADICRRLDGIPLAIELAAARVNLLPVKAIAEKLDDRFRILTGGARTALPRQQTMRATIDWSYNLLSRQEQRLFERLSIFSGGSTLDAAAAVCWLDEGTDADVFDVLSSLIDKSLLVADFEGTDPRYRLLESFREYAREKLVTAGEQAVMAQQHARAYFEIAEQLNAARDTTADLVWNERTQYELDNWRAALEWTLVARRDVALGQRLAGELWMVWATYSALEGRRWVDLALHLVDEGTAAGAVARINYASAVVAGTLDEPEKEFTGSEKALGLYRELGDAFGIALSQVQLCDALVRLGRCDEAEPVLLEALTGLRQLGARRYLGYALRVMGAISVSNGDFTAARTYVAEAIVIYKAIGAQHIAAMAVGIDLAYAELMAGNAQLAFRHASDALPILRAFNGAEVAEALNTMSACLTSLGDYDGAEAYARESLAFSRELHSSAHVARALQRFAVIAVLRPYGAPERNVDPYVRAARLYGFVHARRADLGSPQIPAHGREQKRVSALMLAAMGSDELSALMNAGAAMNEEQAIDEALAT
jgi:predicted ATPase